MQVETYEIEDATSEASAMANDSAAIELIEKLGLTGQSSIMNKETVTRIPYRAMEAREMLVYRALCDEEAALESYSADAIPLRVLQVAAHAKETQMFSKILVWYPKEARIDDPILIGVIKRKTYPDHVEKWMRELTSDTYYMLARWGKTLLSFEKLEALALKTLRARRISQLKKAIVEANTALAVAQETDDLSELAKHAHISL